jgi:hypothetical protein
LPVTHAARTLGWVPGVLLRGGATTTLLAAAFAAFALLALAAAGDGRATLAVAAANTVTFPDSTGEDPAGPDISSVVVSNDDRGNLTFKLNVPNRPTLTGDMLILVGVDSDANPGSGSPDFGGADYLIQLEGPLSGSAAIVLFRWDGTDFTTQGVSAATLIFSYASGATIKVNASELGATRRFSLFAIAVSGIVLNPAGEPDLTNIHVDNAPQQGTFTYDVKVTPPALVVRSSGANPVRPKAGGTYTAFATVARNDGQPMQAGRTTCRGAIGATTLRPTKPGSLAGGRATCAYRIPKTAKGKTIRVTITVTSGGLKAVRTVSARIA